MVKKKLTTTEKVIKSTHIGTSIILALGTLHHASNVAQSLVNQPNLKQMLNERHPAYVEEFNNDKQRLLNELNDQFTSGQIDIDSFFSWIF